MRDLEMPTYSLGEMTWTLPSKKEAVMEKEVLVAVEDLRPGDYVIRGDKTEENMKMSCHGTWDVWVHRQNGVIGYTGIKKLTPGQNIIKEGHKGGRWRPGQGVKLWVRLPRPEPEENEFGAVCP